MSFLRYYTTLLSYIFYILYNKIYNTTSILFSISGGTTSLDRRSTTPHGCLDILPTYKVPTRQNAYRTFCLLTLCLPDKVPTGHFAYHTFCLLTFCLPDIMPTRQSAYKTFCLLTFCLPDIMPTRHFAYLTFCLPTFCLLMKNKFLYKHCNIYKISF